MELISEIVLFILGEVNESKLLSKIMRIMIVTLLCGVLVLIGMFWIHPGLYQEVEPAGTVLGWVFASGGVILWIYGCWKALTFKRKS